MRASCVLNLGISLLRLQPSGRRAAMRRKTDSMAVNGGCHTAAVSPWPELHPKSNPRVPHSEVNGWRGAQE